ncbi:hypothetical protein FACS1894205_7280 [Alphaproteobacteria bacterium]|nr:hypothetical protein FACS1894205_7280 [Alphaproteobacteria bacterium]
MGSFHFSLMIDQDDEHINILGRIAANGDFSGEKRRRKKQIAPFPLVEESGANPSDIRGAYCGCVNALGSWPDRA